MFYLVSFFAIAFFILVICSERYDFANDKHAKRYCARFGMLGFFILQVAIHSGNETLLAVGLVPTTISAIILVLMVVLDYKREQRIVPWFDREGL